MNKLNNGTLNLGLDILNPSTDSICSFELLDDIVAKHKAYEELAILFQEGDKMITSYDNLATLKTHIKKYGITAALEELVDSIVLDDVSKDTLDSADSKRASIVNWFTSVKNKTKIWFKLTFGALNKMKKMTDVALHNINTADFSTRQYQMFTTPELYAYLMPHEMIKKNPSYWSMANIVPKYHTVDTITMVTQLKFVRLRISNVPIMEAYWTKMIEHYSKNLEAERDELSEEKYNEAKEWIEKVTKFFNYTLKIHFDRLDSVVLNLCNHTALAKESGRN